MKNSHESKAIFMFDVQCFALKLTPTLHEELIAERSPFSVPNVGKCFALKSRLTIHENSYGEISHFHVRNVENFSQKGNFFKTSNIHTVSKPFSCSECAMFLLKKPNSITVHERTHQGESHFHVRISLYMKELTQEIIHFHAQSGRKPFSCSDVGNVFAQKYISPYMKNSYRRKSIFSCSENVDKSFLVKSRLSVHERLIQERTIFMGFRMWNAFAFEINAHVFHMKEL
ncbi:gastrula zinc finger protein XlCGF17.1-like, partial [Dendropsophus ebraccatus]|uniref:gastrula zinc finger protein XlCGF17.1-like n=1 Tax=Dendropsophus ebraccatus TaxID=150705 RepID=UPI0038310775